VPEEGRRDPLADLRRELVKALLIGLPVGLFQQLLVRLSGPFSDNPVVVSAILVPLAAAVIWLARPLYAERRLVLGGGHLLFFGAFCLLFSVAAGTRLLDGERQRLIGYDEETPSSFLGLSRLGDWHNWPWVQGVGPEHRDLLIVTHPSFAGQDPVTARRLHADLLVRAIRQGAKGVAFDYVFDGDSDFDPILCHWITEAEGVGVAVFLGYGLRVDERVDLIEIDPPLPSELAGCVAAERWGHVAAYRQGDNRIRMVPLSLGGLEGRPALSLLAARELAAPAEVALPPSGLLQFTRPGFEPPVLEGVPSGQDEALLADRFVFVGSSRPEDRHRTPFGKLAGVTIHAWAAETLRSGRAIERPGRGWTFPGIFALCYLLVALQASGRGRRALLLGAAVLSLAVVAAAALAMRLDLLWIDVSYPLAAIWLLTGLLAGGAALERARRTP